MATVHIPDELDALLEEAAASRGCSKDDLVRDTLAHSVQDEDELQITPELVTLLRDRLAQAREGKFASAGKVEATLARLRSFQTR